MQVLLCHLSEEDSMGSGGDITMENQDRPETSQGTEATPTVVT